jgi:hypothetical protein
VGSDDDFLFLGLPPRRGRFSYAKRLRGVVVLGVYQLKTGLFETVSKVLQVDRLVDRYPHDVFQSYVSSLAGQEKQLLLYPFASHWTGHRLTHRDAG